MLHQRAAKSLQPHLVKYLSSLLIPHTTLLRANAILGLVFQAPRHRRLVLNGWRTNYVGMVPTLNYRKEK